MLADLGVRQVFGVVGSGNFHVTNALIDAGARFVAARHENGAATMADAYGRLSGRGRRAIVHQGCGLTNAMTGIAEAAKSRTPMIVLAAEANDPRSNFYVDQDALATSVGAVSMRVTSAADAVATTVAAYRTAVDERRTVVLNLPLAAQAEELAGGWSLPAPRSAPALRPCRSGARRGSAAVLASAQRPVFVAGRGARSPAARDALRSLADETGALLATSAAAKGLFHDDPWSLDVSGGFATPLAAELIRGADLIVGWGCALNMWTMRHGELIAPGTTVVQVDDEARRPRQAPRRSSSASPVTSRPLRPRSRVERAARYRTDEVGRASPAGAAGAMCRTTTRPPPTASTRAPCRSRSTTYCRPSARCASTRETSWVTRACSCRCPTSSASASRRRSSRSGSVSRARSVLRSRSPDRLTVAALGDGGATMSIAELDTVARLGLDMIVVVYNDEAYGAEVHHFGPDGARSGHGAIPGDRPRGDRARLRAGRCDRAPGR